MCLEMGYFYLYLQITIQTGNMMIHHQIWGTIRPEQDAHRQIKAIKGTDKFAAMAKEKPRT